MRSPPLFHTDAPMFISIEAGKRWDNGQVLRSKWNWERRRATTFVGSPPFVLMAPCLISGGDVGEGRVGLVGVTEERWMM